MRTEIIHGTNRLLFVFSILLLCVVFEAQPTTAQDAPKAVGQFVKSGIVRGIKNGELIIRHKDGSRLTYKIQDKDEDGLALGNHIMSFPAKIAVNGLLPATLLEQGMLVRFDSAVNKFGKQKEPVKELKIVNLELQDYNLDLDEQPKDKDVYVPCTVQGRIMRVGQGKVTVAVPRKYRLAPRNRITFELDPKAKFKIASDNLNRVVVGDRVNRMKGVKLSDGTRVIVQIDITLNEKRKATTFSFHEQLEQKYSLLSDEPREPREVSSDHFILYTDISDRSAKILLAKLETMRGLVSEYYSRRHVPPIECYVVGDLSQWENRLPFEAKVKIAEGAGVTATFAQGRKGKAIVYSCDDHDVVQHEAVHAFCGQAFGSPGPVWYAEGMAELGQYWRPGKLEVNIDPVVIEYLRHAKPKKMRDIVKEDEISGDSWQAYAWRWALCHLLANNPNYAQRFKQLGIKLMLNKDDSFDAAFGDKANEISFEYDQFVENFGNGYRVDLCTWDWNVKTIKVGTDKYVKAKVDAMSGWQPSRLKVKKGVIYDFVTKGEWKLTEDGQPLNADGNEDGDGQLIGRVLKNYRLSDPINLGKRGSFKAPASGQLYLRCSDDWTDLANNSGTVECILRLSKRNKQLNADASKEK